MAAFRSNIPSFGHHQNQQNHSNGHFAQNHFANNQFAQNVPRGTFPQNLGQHFGNNFGVHGNMGRSSGHHMQGSQQHQQYQQQMARQNQQQRPQMQARQQMPMAGQFQGMQSGHNMQGMTNMPSVPNQPSVGNMQNVSRMLNPTNDPHVRFEAVPEHMQQAASPTPSVVPAAPVNVGQANIGEVMVQRLANLLQGEGNSIVYYGNLVKASGAKAREKQLINELIESKRRQLRHAVEMYKGVASSEWGGQEMQTQHIGNLRDGISYALLQESRLLREASQIYADMGGSAARDGMLSVLHGKIADIAHLMAI